MRIFLKIDTEMARCYFLFPESSLSRVITMRYITGL